MKANAKDAAATTGADIRIDGEFARLIPPLAQQELRGLQRSLLTEGCRDALIVWKNGNRLILLDGHNRLRICRKHNLPFRVIYKDLPDRATARTYIIALQLSSRRNLSREAAAYLRGKRYLAEKQSHGGDRTSNGASHQDDGLPTAQRLAEEYKVGAATIERDGRFAQAVDGIVANCGEEARDLLLSQDTRVTRHQVMELDGQQPAAQRKFIQALKTHGTASVKRPAHQRTTITLPRKRGPLVEQLVERLGRAEASAVCKLLGQVLQGQREAAK